MIAARTSSTEIFGFAHSWGLVLAVAVAVVAAMLMNPRSCQATAMKKRQEVGEPLPSRMLRFSKAALPRCIDQVL